METRFGNKGIALDMEREKEWGRVMNVHELTGEGVTSVNV